MAEPGFMSNYNNPARRPGTPRSRHDALDRATDVRAALITALQASSLVVLEVGELRELDLDVIQGLPAAPTDGSLRNALLRGGFLSVCSEGDE